MTVFVAIALGLVALTLALLIWPLRRRRDGNAASADFSRQQLNTLIYRDQLTELERDRAAGTLSQADYEQARNELQRRMLEDVTPDAHTAATSPRSRALTIGLATVLPIAALALYLVIGTPAAINAPAHQQRFSQDDIERMVAGLAAKLEGEPDNYKGWAMLARSYKAMGRFPEAVRAYERTGTMLDSSPDLLVDYADTLAASTGGFNPKVMTLIDKALQLDPANAQGLWMRGTAAFESQRYAQAVADWQKLLALLEPGSDDARTVEANIAEAQAKGGLPVAKAKVGDGRTAMAAGGNASIKGRVEIAPTVAGKLPANGVIMVVARPNDGSRMPVAVFRTQGKLPMEFTLDDSQAMNPANPLSKYPEVVIEARVSQSGQAIPQPGDLFGSAQTVKLGAKQVVLKVDQVRQ